MGVEVVLAHHTKAQQRLLGMVVRRQLHAHAPPHTHTHVSSQWDRTERSYGLSGTDLSGGQQGGPLGGGTHAPVEAGPAFRAIDLLERMQRALL